MSHARSSFFFSCGSNSVLQLWILFHSSDERIRCPGKKGSFECILILNSIHLIAYENKRRAKKKTLKKTVAVVIDTQSNGKGQEHRVIETRTHFNRFVLICAETQKHWKSFGESPKNAVFKSMMAEVVRVATHQKNANDCVRCEMKEYSFRWIRRISPKIQFAPHD